MFSDNTPLHEEILGSLGRPDFCKKNHALLMELHFVMFPDHGKSGLWKKNPIVGFLVSTGLGKINKNTIWTYKVDYPLNIKVQANIFKNQGVIHVLSFFSSSKTLTPSNIHETGHSKLNWRN